MRYQKTNEQYAADFHVSLRTVGNWKKKKYPLDDPKKLRAMLDDQKNVPKSQESDEKKTLQVRKLKAECVRLERENAVKAGELIPLSEYIEINARVDAEICKGLDELAVELSPKVFGMKTIAEISVKVREATDRIKAALYDPARTPVTSE